MSCKNHDKLFVSCKKIIFLGDLYKSYLVSNVNCNFVSFVRNYKGCVGVVVWMPG